MRHLSKSSLSLFSFALATAALLLIFSPDLAHKIKAGNADKQYAMALDFGDVALLGGQLEALQAPVPAFLILPFDAPDSVEKMVRSAGFLVLWRPSDSEEQNVPQILERVKAGDGVLPRKEFVFGYPGRLRTVVDVLRSKQGFLPLVEFGEQKGRGFLFEFASDLLVKTHVLPMEEMLVPKPELWVARLARAVKERGIRLLVVRLSPAMSWPDNLLFLRRIQTSLSERGFSLLHLPSSPAWPTIGVSVNMRTSVILLFSILAPLAGLLFIRRFHGPSPFLTFSMVSGLSLLAGIALYAVGSTPALSSGFSSIRGVKLQLILPLLAAVFLLWSPRELHKLLDVNLTVRHVVIVGGLLGLVGLLYLMRSGNFPLLTVSDHERALRDMFESFFGARPRTKEFLFAHPIMMTGLFMMSMGKKRTPLFDPRILIVIGLIGQISILNTFLHLHTPLYLGVQRTLHGLWLGFLFSLPLCYAAMKWAWVDERQS